MGGGKNTLSGLIFLSVSLIFSIFVVKRIKSKGSNGARHKKRHTLIHFAINNLIMILVGLSYPFYKQTSSYQRIGVKENKDADINCDTGI